MGHIQPQVASSEATDERRTVDHRYPGSATPDIVTDALLLTETRVCDISSPKCLDESGTTC